MSRRLSPTGPAHECVDRFAADRARAPRTAWHGFCESGAAMSAPTPPEAHRPESPALDALDAIDLAESEPEGLFAALERARLAIDAEGVLWFVGVVLVLAGSLYFTESNWDAWSPVVRAVVVTGGLVLYQALFVGLATFLRARGAPSLPVRVLAGLGAALVATIGWASSSLIATAPGAALAALVVAAGLVAAALRAGREAPAKPARSSQLRTLAPISVMFALAASRASPPIAIAFAALALFVCAASVWKSVAWDRPTRIVDAVYAAYLVAALAGALAAHPSIDPSGVCAVVLALAALSVHGATRGSSSAAPRIVVVVVSATAMGVALTSDLAPVAGRIAMLATALLSTAALFARARHDARRLPLVLAMLTGLFVYFFLPAPFRAVMDLVLASAKSALGYEDAPLPVAYYGLTFVPYLAAWWIAERRGAFEHRRTVRSVLLAIVALLVGAAMAELEDPRPALFTLPLYIVAFAIDAARARRASTAGSSDARSPSLAFGSAKRIVAALGALESAKRVVAALGALESAKRVVAALGSPLSAHVAAGLLVAFAVRLATAVFSAPLLGLAFAAAALTAASIVARRANPYAAYGIAAAMAATTAPFFGEGPLLVSTTAIGVGALTVLASRTGSRVLGVASLAALPVVAGLAEVASSASVATFAPCVYFALARLEARSPVLGAAARRLAPISAFFAVVIALGGPVPWWYAAPAAAIAVAEPLLTRRPRWLFSGSLAAAATVTAGASTIGLPAALFATFTAACLAWIACRAQRRSSAAAALDLAAMTAAVGAAFATADLPTAVLVLLVVGGPIAARRFGVPSPADLHAPPRLAVDVPAAASKLTAAAGGLATIAALGAAAALLAPLPEYGREILASTVLLLGVVSLRALYPRTSTRTRWAASGARALAKILSPHAPTPRVSARTRWFVEKPPVSAGLTLPHAPRDDARASTPTRRSVEDPPRSAGRTLPHAPTPRVSAQRRWVVFAAMIFAANTLVGSIEETAFVTGAAAAIAVVLSPRAPRWWRATLAAALGLALALQGGAAALAFVVLFGCVAAFALRHTSGKARTHDLDLLAPPLALYGLLALTTSASPAAALPPALVLLGAPFALRRPILLPLTALGAVALAFVAHAALGLPLAVGLTAIALLAAAATRFLGAHRRPTEATRSPTQIADPHRHPTEATPPPSQLADTHRRPESAPSAPLCDADRSVATPGRDAHRLPSESAPSTPLCDAVRSVNTPDRDAHRRPAESARSAPHCDAVRSVATPGRDTHRRPAESAGSTPLFDAVRSLATPGRDALYVAALPLAVLLLAVALVTAFLQPAFSPMASPAAFLLFATWIAVLGYAAFAVTGFSILHATTLGALAIGAAPTLYELLSTAGDQRPEFAVAWTGVLLTIALVLLVPLHPHGRDGAFYRRAPGRGAPAIVAFLFLLLGSGVELGLASLPSNDGFALVAVAMAGAAMLLAHHHPTGYLRVTAAAMISVAGAQIAVDLGALLETTSGAPSHAAVGAAATALLLLVAGRARKSTTAVAFVTLAVAVALTGLATHGFATTIVLGCLTTALALVYRLHPRAAVLLFAVAAAAATTSWGWFGVGRALSTCRGAIAIVPFVATGLLVVDALLALLARRWHPTPITARALDEALDRPPVDEPARARTLDQTPVDEPARTRTPVDEPAHIRPLDQTPVDEPASARTLDRSALDEHYLTPLRRARVALAAATLALVGSHVALAAAPTLVESAVVALVLLALLVRFVRVARRRGRTVDALFVEGTLFVGWQLLRRQGDLFAEVAHVDAYATMVAAFLFTGVHALARRGVLSGAYERSARLFAMILPAAAALLYGLDVSWSTAGLLTIASLAYAVAARTGIARVAAPIATVAFNAATVVAWLTAGVSDPQLYALPVGLSILLLGHLYRADLSERALATLRLVALGGVYLSSFVSILAFDDPAHSLVMACLAVAGAVAGLVLRIRSYLLCGAGFLVVDLGTSVVRFGLSGQTAATLVLTSLGLALLGALVVWSLHRSTITRAVAAFGVELREWET